MSYRILRMVRIKMTKNRWEQVFVQLKILCDLMYDLERWQLSVAHLTYSNSP